MATSKEMRLEEISRKGYAVEKKEKKGHAEKGKRVGKRRDKGTFRCLFVYCTPGSSTIVVL